MESEQDAGVGEHSEAAAPEEIKIQSFEEEFKEEIKFDEEKGVERNIIEEEQDISDELVEQERGGYFSKKKDMKMI